MLPQRKALKGIRSMNLLQTVLKICIWESYDAHQKGTNLTDYKYVHILAPQLGQSYDPPLFACLTAPHAAPWVHVPEQNLKGLYT